MGRVEGRPLLALLAASGAAFLLAGCAGAIRQAQVERTQGLEKDIEGHFAAIQGRFTEAHIQSCLDARKKAGVKFVPIAKPIYQPNYFYTCVANTDGRTQEMLQQAPGHYSVAYVVRVPVSRPPHIAETSAAGKNGKTEWYYVARCSFKVDRKAIQYQDDSRADIFIPTAGSGSFAVRHDCMSLPNAAADLAAAQKDLAFQSITIKPASPTAAASKAKP